VISDQTRSTLAHFLRGKGMSEDDIRRACDIGLGIGRSTKFGGAFGGNFGGNLHSEIDQPRTRPSDPSSRDACLEEELGIEPAKDYRNRRMHGRDSRRMGGDRLDFGMLYGLEPTIAAAQPRRRRTANQIAMDTAGHDTFERMFPEATRVGWSEHDFSRR
jgi:hypothetical protein